MAKTQSYTIVFNEAQNNIDDAFDTVSAGINDGVSTMIANGLLAGNIIDVTESLSSDKMTLTVTREWSDSAYDSLIAVQTVDQIKSAVAGLSAVQSIEYEFTDS